MAIFYQEFWLADCSAASQSETMIENCCLQIATVQQPVAKW